MAKKQLTPVDLRDVKINGPFWSQWMTINRERTIPYQRSTYTRMSLDDAPRMSAQWIETASYSIVSHPDPQLETILEEQVEMIAERQEPDGQISKGIEPEKRWTNLRDQHELYSVGHLIEAGVAYFQATGKPSLLDVARRAAEHVATIFGSGPGQKRGYPGHEEIELALIRLYQATGERRHADLAKFFVDERGKQPHYYEEEARARGEKPAAYCRAGQFPGGYPWFASPTTSYWQLSAKQARDFANAPTEFAETTMRIPGEEPYEYCQAHRPVREQDEVVGHGVRGMYLYSAMADVAAEYDDDELLEACKRLWGNLTERRMYVTGGVGSSICNEGFTADYHLPNETCYCETCAACALVHWAHRMLQFACDGRYADVMERALCNGALVGLALDGEHFFYINQLTSLGDLHRQEWFKCACCPPNIARLIASVGRLAYSQTETDAVVHLYVGGSASLAVDGQTVGLQVDTDYPWDGKVTIKVDPEQSASFGVKLRVPAWCRGFRIAVNGTAVGSPEMVRGYIRVESEWKEGDRIELDLAMPIDRVRAHPNVVENNGHVAIQRGPIIYCLEQVDNDVPLNRIVLPKDASLEHSFRPDLLDGVVEIRGEALVRDDSNWGSHLYRGTGEMMKPFEIRAVPYYAWDNREPGEMRVWIREKI
jgi:uncharacterized protein